MTVPADAPPLFVALAADDPFFANAGFGLIESWRAAKKPAEFHLYEQGGHGFGMYPKETTSTGWFNAFVSWLTMHGMLKPRGRDRLRASGRRSGEEIRRDARIQVGRVARCCPDAAEPVSHVWALLVRPDLDHGDGVRGQIECHVAL